MNYNYELLLPLDHDDVVAKLGFDRRIGIRGVAQGRDGQGEGRVLEGSNHRTTGLKGVTLFEQRLPASYLVSRVVQDTELFCLFCRISG